MSQYQNLYGDGKGYSAGSLDTILQKVFRENTAQLLSIKVKRLYRSMPQAIMSMIELAWRGCTKR